MSFQRIFFGVPFLLLACQQEPVVEDTASSPAEPSAQIIRLSPAQLEQASLTMVKAERRSIGAELAVQGTIDVPPQNMVSISAPLGGYVRSTKLLPGMEVQRGEELAVLEDASFVQLQQDYLVAKARIGMLEADAQRQAVLNASKTASDKVLQEATTALNTERITLNALGEKLRLIGLDPDQLQAERISRTVPLRSPIHGWVSSVQVNVGKYVAATEVLFELVDPTDIHLQLDVFEKDLPMVRIGQHVHARATADPSKQLEAEIILVSRSLDNEHSAKVHCHFKDMPKDLVPGIAMFATIETGRDTAWTVPQDAVLRTSDGQSVFIAKGPDTFQMIPVKTGVASENMVELVDPPAELLNAEIVLKGAFSLLMVVKNSEEE